MQAGALRHQFLFEADAGTDDAATGQHNEAWTAVTTRWGDHVPAHLRNSMAVRAIYPTAEYVIILRYASNGGGILPAQRVTQIDNGDVYDVIGTPVDPDGQRREMYVPVAKRGVLHPVAP